MDSFDGPDDLFIQVLLENMRCISCGGSFGAEDVDVLGYEDGAWFVSVVCPRCKTHGLIMAIIADDGESDGDLIFEMDISPLPITENEVWEFHTLLQHFEGDMFELLELFDSV